MVLGSIENLGLVCENEGGDDDEVDTGLVDEWRHTPTIDSTKVIRTNRMWYLFGLYFCQKYLF